MVMNKLLSHPDRALANHLKGVRSLSIDKFERISRYIDWENVFGYKKEEIEKVLEISALFHDIGKATKNFQKKLEGEKTSGAVHHTPLSSFFTAKILHDLGISPFLIYCGYSIVRFHHGRLKSPQEEFISLEEIKKDLKVFNESIFNEIGFSRVEIDPENVYQIISDVSFDAEDEGKRGYFLIKLLFSILTSSDREDVVFKGERLRIESLELGDLEKFMETLKIKTYLDKLRMKFHREVASFKGNGDIFTISAPTGIGKTLANIRLALNIKSANGSVIVYSLPLINIIEQTAEVMKKVFGTNAVMEYHHLSDEFSQISEEFTEEDIERIRKYNVQYQTWYSPLVVTTFVSLLEGLIGGSKAPFFHRLPGGVLILDEVQAIPHEKWGIVKEIIEFLPKIGVKVIISTATMPVLFQGISVVKKREYHEKLDRFVLKIEKEKTFDEFKSWVTQLLKDGKSTLIIMNTIKSAEDIWESIGKKACFLSSRVLPLHRSERTKELKKGEYKICVSTQVVEAGVDISFERVVRDIAPLDSLIQAAGRCNRHFEKNKGEVYIVPVVDDKGLISKRIYGKFLVEKTMEVIKEYRILRESELKDLIEQYYSKLVKLGGTDEKNFVKALKNMDISYLDSFRLIEDFMNISFLILIDEYANEIYSKMIEISKKLSGIEKNIAVTSYLRKLSPYIVNTMVYEKENLGAFEINWGMAVIREENIMNWYDPIKGLKLKSDGGFII